MIPRTNRLCIKKVFSVGNVISVNELVIQFLFLNIVYLHILSGIQTAKLNALILDAKSIITR